MHKYSFNAGSLSGTQTASGACQSLASLMAAISPEMHWTARPACSSITQALSELHRNLSPAERPGCQSLALYKRSISRDRPRNCTVSARSQGNENGCNLPPVIGPCSSADLFCHRALALHSQGWRRRHIGCVRRIGAPFSFPSLSGLIQLSLCSGSGREGHCALWGKRQVMFLVGLIKPHDVA